MLPTLPELAEDYRRYSYQRIRLLSVQSSPMISSVSRHILQEGRASRIHRADGSVGDMEVKEVGAGFELKNEEFNTYSEPEVEKRRKELAAKFAEETVTNMVEMFNETTSRTGNTIDGRNRPFHEAMLDAIEMLPATLDGDPLMFMVSPAIADKLQAQREFLDRDPEVQRRLKEIFFKKEGERRARKADRRLVG